MSAQNASELVLHPVLVGKRKADFRPSISLDFLFQREWVEGRGLFLVVAFFLGGLGAGLYLLSMFLNFYPGLITGFLIVLVGKGGAHMIFLGRPWRFWRGFANPQTSWISRGLIAILLFLIPAVMQIAATLPGFTWLPWTVDNLAIQIWVIIGAVSLMAYTGFALSAVKAIRSWNSGMIPLMFIIYSFMGGIGLGLGMLAGLNTGIEMASVERTALGLMIAVIVLWIIYIWTTHDSNAAGARSVMEMLKGRASLYFIVGVIILGLVIPLTVIIISLSTGQVSPAVIAIAAGCEILGGFSMRYSIFKSGVYTPMV
jgi:formate-dependent nitrite reductase membrane component NrfD